MNRTASGARSIRGGSPTAARKKEFRPPRLITYGSQPPNNRAGDALRAMRDEAVLTDEIPGIQRSVLHRLTSSDDP
jgi:hypothetical protein